MESRVTPVAVIGMGCRLPGGSTRPTNCGSRCCAVMTWSPRFRPTAGTPTTITTLSQGFPGGRCPGGVGSLTTSPVSMLSSSGLASGSDLDRSAAAATAGNVVGGDRACWSGSGVVGRVLDGRFYWADPRGLPGTHHNGGRFGQSICGYRPQQQCGVRADRAHIGSTWSGDDV